MLHPGNSASGQLIGGKEDEVMLELLAAQTAWAGTAMGRAAAVEVEVPAYGLRGAVVDAFFGGISGRRRRAARSRRARRKLGGRTYSVPAIRDVDHLFGGGP
jgi:hypothetical protein